ncbi:MAG: hypothetical protein RL186_987 [Pseudomonadota bacterium]
MTDTTTNLGLPYVLASQADKHVTFNEAMERLDLLTQLVVASATVTGEPSAPVEGVGYILPAGRTGPAWGNLAANSVVRYGAGGWFAIAPQMGWLAFVRDTGQLLMFGASGWTQSGARASLGLGSAASGNLGTSGATIPLLDGENVWAKTQKFAGDLAIEHAQPNLHLKDTDALANEKSWRLGASGPRLTLMTINDAQAGVALMQADRSGGAPASVCFPFDGRFGFGTDNPSAHGGDLVLTRTKAGGQTILKIGNPTAASGSSARLDLATGVPNAYALLGLTNTSATGADLSLSAGGGVNWCNFFVNRYMFKSATGADYLAIEPNQVRPGSDNAMALGQANARWSVVYATTGVINTSDAREKTPLAPVSDALARVATRLRSQIGIFQWLESVARKGSDQARLHIGLTAQSVAEAFVAEGLDPNAYALFCADQPVGDTQGEARLGLRVDQLLWLLAARA